MPEAPRPLRVLILEDRPADAELMAAALRRYGVASEWRRVETEADYRAALADGWQVVLAGFNRPGFGAPAALRILQERGGDIPLIVVSGTVGEDTAVQCVRAGAADYLLKDRLGRLGPAVEAAVERWEGRRRQRRLEDERQRAADELEVRRRDAESRAGRMQTLVRLNALISASLDRHRVLTEITRAAAELTGAALVGVWVMDDADGAIRVAAVSDEDLFADYPARTLPLGRSVAGRAVLEHRLQDVADVERTPGIIGLDWWRRHGLRSLRTVPIASGDQVLGVLGLCGREPFLLTGEDQELFESFVAQAATAIRNADLFAETGRRRLVAEGLARLGQALSRSLDTADVARRVVDGIRQVLEIPTVTVWELVAGADQLVLLAAGGLGPGYREGMTIPAGAGGVGLAVREGQPVFVADLLADPRVVLTEPLTSAIQGLPSRAMAGLPLLFSGRPIGALGVATATGRPFSPADMVTLQLFADQAAEALANARLVSDLRTREHHLEALLEGGRWLSGSLDLTEVGQRVVTRVRELFGARRAALYLLEPDGSQRLAAESSAPGLPATVAVTFAPGGGLLGLAIEQDSAVATTDILTDPRMSLPAALRGYLEQHGLGAFIGAPLRVAGKPIGGLVVGDRTGRRFTAADVSVVETFAAHAAVALANARLFQEAASARERLYHLIEATPTIVYSVELHGEPRATFVSPNVQEVFGHAAGEFLADPGFWRAHVHPEDVTSLTARRPEAVGRGGDRVEYRFRHRDGSWRWTLDEFRLVRDAAGQPVEMVGHWSDVTERKRAEAALRETEKLAAMGALLAGVAHELNNPLSVVLGQSRLLQDRPEARARERAETIGRAAERCARIVRNFLALARRRPTERQAMVLGDVVREAVELVAYPLRVDGVEVDLQLAPDLPELWADPHQVHQVVVNLISNAHHALRAAGGLRRITVTTVPEPTGQHVVLEVADTGPGIPPEVLPRLFEPFFTTKPPGEGTGLGLALCRGIVESHDGTITGRNSPDGGAVFRVELPVGAPGGPGPRPPAMLPEPGPEARPGRILVVDDEAEIAQLLAEIIRTDGHQVDVALGGQEALERVAAGGCDLVISDLRMPGLDGPGLYRRLEATGFPVATAMAFITGDLLTGETQRFLESAGAVSIAKPFSSPQVLAGVRQALARARDQRTRS